MTNEQLAAIFAEAANSTNPMNLQGEQLRKLGFVNMVVSPEEMVAANITGRVLRAISDAYRRAANEEASDAG